MARRSAWCVAKSSMFVDSGRVLFGADDNTRGFTGPEGIETQMGRKMGIRNRHYSWNANVAQIGQRWAADTADGCVPMISLGGQGYSEALVREIAAGQHDAYWRSLFAELKTPGLFRPWMEMNGAHNSYNQSAPAFVAMWKHVRSLTAAHLTWIWCPQQYDPRETWPTFYPGDDVVDWVGLDLYRNVFATGDPWRLFARLHQKPYAICESGFEQGVVVTDPASGVTYDKDGSKTGRSLIAQTRADVKAHPNTVAYIVWNNIGPIGNDFIDTSPKSLAQYREFAADNRYKFA